MRFYLCHGVFLSVSFLIYIAIADLHWPNGFPWGKALGVRISVSFPPAIPTYKKILPSRTLGREQFMLRGATQIRKFPWNFPHLRRKAGCAARRFRCDTPYTPARRTSFPGRLQKPFSKAAFSLGSSELPVLLPRRRSLSDRFLVFHHDTPIQIAALQSEDQHFGRGQIGRAGDIVRIAQAERAHDALILPRVGVVRV